MVTSNTLTVYWLVCGWLVSIPKICNYKERCYLTRPASHHTCKGTSYASSITFRCIFMYIRTCTIRLRNCITLCSYWFRYTVVACTSLLRSNPEKHTCGSLCVQVVYAFLYDFFVFTRLHTKLNTCILVRVCYTFPRECEVYTVSYKVLTTRGKKLYLSWNELVRYFVQ